MDTSDAARLGRLFQRILSGSDGVELIDARIRDAGFDLEVRVDLSPEEAELVRSQLTLSK